MLRTTFAFWILCAASLFAGCGEEPVPAEPGFAADVRPIMVARCVRCHGAGGKLNGDPLSQKGLPPEAGYFEQYGDVGCGPMDPPLGCKRGALFYAKLGTGPTNVLRSLIFSKGVDRMPPPPAETLSDRQLEVIDRWLAEATPKP